jgi:hypothetical protein
MAKNKTANKEKRNKLKENLLAAITPLLSSENITAADKVKKKVKRL